jgi:hypothetical protein
MYLQWQDTKCLFIGDQVDQHSTVCAVEPLRSKATGGVAVMGSAFVISPI